MRPRLTNTDLPNCVYLRGRAYYWKAPNGRWINLGRDRQAVDARLLRFAEVKPNPRTIIEVYAYKILTRARHNAKGRRQIEFSLTKEDVLDLLNQSHWRCAVTGCPFSLAEVGLKRRRPFAPSIDRIDSAVGYTRQNCRMVCVAANYAMNIWGDIIFDVWLASGRKVSKSLDALIGSGK